MSETTEKIYCYDNPNNNCANWAAAAALMGRKDNTAETLALMNNGGWNGNPFIYLVWMYMMRWMNGNEWGGSNGVDYNSRAIAQLQDTVNTNHNNDLVLQGVNGNAAAINELANAFGTNNAIMQGAINNVRSAIDHVAAQSGITGERVINSVILGNKDIQQQLCQCCCDNKMAVTQMGYEGQIRDLQNTQTVVNRVDQLANGIAQGFSATAYENQKQTSELNFNLQNQTQALKDMSNANTDIIIAKLNQMTTDGMQDKINTLTAELTAAHSRAERAAELAPIISQLNAIKAAQPATTTVQYPQLTIFPSYLNTAAQAGFYNSGSGFWG